MWHLCAVRAVRQNVGSCVVARLSLSTTSSMLIECRNDEVLYISHVEWRRSISNSNLLPFSLHGSYSPLNGIIFESTDMTRWANQLTLKLVPSYLSQLCMEDFGMIPFLNQMVSHELLLEAGEDQWATNDQSQEFRLYHKALQEFPSR